MMNITLNMLLWFSLSIWSIYEICDAYFRKGTWDSFCENLYPVPLYLLIIASILVWLKVPIKGPDIFSGLMVTVFVYNGFADLKYMSAKRSLIWTTVMITPWIFVWIVTSR